MLAMLVTAACDSGQDGNILNVGVGVPSSGTLEDVGTGMLRGMELARDEVNDSKRLGDTRLAFITVDSKSTTEGTAAAFNKLINEDRVSVILGPYSSSSTSRIISTIDGEKVVTFSPTSAANGLSAKSTWLFRSSLTVDRLVPTGIRVSKSHLNYRNVATLVNNADTFSVSSQRKITAELVADSDITIVSAQSYSRSAGDTLHDITPQLTDIQNANPDAIFFSGLPEDRFGIVTQAHALGITNTPFISTLLAIDDVKRINTAAPGAAEGIVTFQVWLSASDVALSKTFVTSFLARHGTEPNDFAARAYAAVQILAEALSHATNYEAAAVQRALANIKDLDTIYGSFAFDDHGDALYEPLVARVKNNEFAILK